MSLNEPRDINEYRARVAFLLHSLEGLDLQSAIFKAIAIDVFELDREYDRLMILRPQK